MGKAKRSLEQLVASLRTAQRRGGPQPKQRLALVREHGIDAIRALLMVEHPKWKAEVSELDAPGCPWPYGEVAPLEVAKRALGPLAKRLPKTLARLGSAELVVAVQHEPQRDAPDRGGWFLLYALPAEHGIALWIAGPPTPEPSFALDGWTLPEPLRELYAQHDGFGELCDEFGWTGVDPGVQPLVHLCSPSIELEDEDELVAADLLRFTRGVGEAGESGWCFARAAAGKLSIRELDDEFGLLGRAQRGSVWSFFDRYFVDELRVED